MWKKLSKDRQATNDSIILCIKYPICMQGKEGKSTDSVITRNTHCFSTATVVRPMGHNVTF